MFICQRSLFGVPWPLKLTSVLQVILKRKSPQSKLFSQTSTTSRNRDACVRLFLQLFAVPQCPAQVREPGGVGGLEVPVPGAQTESGAGAGGLLAAGLPHLQRSQGSCWEATLCRGGDRFAVLSFPATGCVFVLSFFFLNHLFICKVVTEVWLLARQRGGWL